MLLFIPISLKSPSSVIQINYLQYLLTANSSELLDQCLKTFALRSSIATLLRAWLMPFILHVKLGFDRTRKGCSNLFWKSSIHVSLSRFFALSCSICQINHYLVWSQSKTNKKTHPLNKTEYPTFFHVQIEHSLVKICYATKNPNTFNSI